MAKPFWLGGDVTGFHQREVKKVHTCGLPQEPDSGGALVWRCPQRPRPWYWSTRQVDGRGIATDYTYNQLNQVVQITRSAAHDVFLPDPAEPVGLTNFQYVSRYFYDFLHFTNEGALRVGDIVFDGLAARIEAVPRASTF